MYLLVSGCKGHTADRHPFINTACDLVPEIVTVCIYGFGLVKELFRTYMEPLD